MSDFIGMVVARASELAPRTDWSRAQLEAHQTTALRGVIAHAKERSAFWRDRLAALDPATVALEDLATLPPLTKDELMAHWDSISTVEGLTLARAEEQIERATGEGVAGCQVMASSGTSGRVVVMAHAPSTALDFVAAFWDRRAISRTRRRSHATSPMASARTEAARAIARSSPSDTLPSGAPAPIGPPLTATYARAISSIACADGDPASSTSRASSERRRRVVAHASSAVDEEEPRPHGD